jgi:hypothetical protein
MIQKEIDLTGFKDKGVTLYVAFETKGPIDPFYIFISDPTGHDIYYYRQINKPNVMINLPEHSDKVILKVMADHPVQSIIKQPIQITKIKYNPKSNIITPRDYKISDIQTQVLPVISIPQIDNNGERMRNYDGSYIMMPTNQPARFMPSIGLKQLSAAILSKYPQPVRQFVIDHEEGHYYYGRNIPSPDVLQLMPQDMQREYQNQLLEDEEAADDYALHKMINDGYNWSGAFTSLTDYLPDNYISNSRINKMFNTIQKYHKRLQQ